MNNARVAARLVKLAKTITSASFSKKIDVGSRVLLHVRQNIQGYTAKEIAVKAKQCENELKKDLSQLSENFTIHAEPTVVLAGRYVFIDAVAASDDRAATIMLSPDYETITRELGYK